jgi:hypothetical protein
MNKVLCVLFDTQDIFSFRDGLSRVLKTKLCSGTAEARPKLARLRKQKFLSY